MMFSFFHDVAHETWMFCLIVALVLFPVGWRAVKALRTPRSLAKRIGLGAVVAVEALFCALGVGGCGIEIGHIHEKADSVMCESNIRNLSYAVLQYMQDSDETAPPAGKWGDLVAPYVNKRDPEPTLGFDPKKAWHCPAASSPYGYAMNDAMSSVKLDKVGDPTTTILLFESDAQTRNAHGGVAQLPAEPRHFGTENYALLDGTQVYRMRKNVTKTGMLWKP
jgi:hypothetical protein